MGKTYAIAPRVDFQPLPTGDYVLTLLEVKEVVEERDTAFSKRGDVRLEFHWEVQVPGEEPEERRDWSGIPRTFSKKSKFVAIAVALGLVSDAEGAEQGANIDFDDGLGKRCLGTIVRAQKPNSDEWTDKITGYARLDRLPTTRSRRPEIVKADPSDLGDIPF